MKNFNKVLIVPLIIVVIGALLAGAFFFIYKERGDSQKFISADQAAEKAVNFINDNKESLTGGLDVLLVSAVEQGGLYRIRLTIGEQEYDSYISKDGRFLFPIAYDLEEIEKETGEAVLEEQDSSKLDESDFGEGFSDNELEFLAKCLTQKGAKFYGTDTCPWCIKQKEMFGQAAEYLPYIDCAEKNIECEAADVGGVPDWRFPDGSQQSGMLPVEELIKLSGCLF